MDEPNSSHPKPDFRMKCIFFFIATVISYTTGVCGTPTTQNDLKDVIGMHTTPQRVQTPDVQKSVNDTRLFISRADGAQEWICIVASSSADWAVAVGNSQSSALSAAQSGCGSQCDNSRCVQRGCIAMATSGRSSGIARKYGYGSRNADAVQAQYRAIYECRRQSGGVGCTRPWSMCSVHAN
jgi:hypothetical protein